MAIEIDHVMDYSTKKVSNELILEVIDAIQNIRGWGSVDIQIQDYTVVQITERNIKKTSATTVSQTKKKHIHKIENSRS